MYNFWLLKNLDADFGDAPHTVHLYLRQ